jgi:hypothetical protein
LRVAIIPGDTVLGTGLAKLLAYAEVSTITLDPNDRDLLKSAGDGQYQLVIVDQDLPFLGDHSLRGDNVAKILHDRGTAAVLVAQYALKDDRMFELLRTDAVTGLIGLDVPVPEVARAIRDQLPGRRFPNCVAHFYVDSGNVTDFWAAMADDLSGRGVTVDSDECSLLFRRLISPCARKVELRGAPGGQSGAKVLRAAVSCGDGPVVEDLAIKYGDKRQIRNEAMHYDRFVGPLPDGVAAQLRWRADTTNLGALAYSWVGDSVEDGIALGPLENANGIVTWERRRKVIDRLFTVSLNSWYKIYRSKELAGEDRRKLLSYYKGGDGVLPDSRLLSQLPQSLPETFVPSCVVSGAEEWYFVHRRAYLRNPVKWLFTTSIGSDRVPRLSPCHGDLHVRNIYVLPDDSPRLIDFGTTTVGHVYRDFAALETSIRLACVDDTDLDALSTAEDRVCSVRSLADEIDFRGLGGSSDLREAVRTTINIRKAALEASGYHMSARDSIHQYLFAVVAHMLRYATGRADEASRSEASERRGARVWHALYGAARAATELARLQGEAVPEVGNSRAHGTLS